MQYLIVLVIFVLQIIAIQCLMSIKSSLIIQTRVIRSQCFGFDAKHIFKLFSTNPDKRTNYERMLEQAKQKKNKDISTSQQAFTATNNNINSNINNNNNQESISAVPWKYSTDDLKSAKERAQFKSKIPFNDEMYTILKTTIQLLTKRVNEKVILTTKEAEWLSMAVSEIMEDAYKYGPPVKPIPIAENTGSNNPLKKNS